mgnify:CR=1 FL=1
MLGSGALIFELGTTIQTPQVIEEIGKFSNKSEKRDEMWR